MTNDEEFKEIDDAEEQGKKNILKYFDRLHDKLFTFNNIMIIGFFAISKIDTNISIKNILIPLFNLVFLIFIEYRMMELSRAESNIKKIPVSDLPKKLYKKYNSVTLYSLGSIITTAIVTIIFLHYLLF
jgi:hypothetical protein